MVYLLEDDESIRRFVIYALKQTGMEAEGFPLPSLFREAVAHKKPDDVVALPFQKKSRHGTVYAAAHSDDNGFCHFIRSLIIFVCFQNKFFCFFYFGAIAHY